jgi:hypothetical protein
MHAGGAEGESYPETEPIFPARLQRGHDMLDRGTLGGQVLLDLVGCPHETQPQRAPLPVIHGEGEAVCGGGGHSERKTERSLRCFHQGDFEECRGGPCLTAGLIIAPAVLL